MADDREPSALALIDDWPGGPRAAAVIVDGEVVLDRGDVWAPLPWASVTKLATALAVLIAVSRELVDLETVRPLLAHFSAARHRRVYDNESYELAASMVPSFPSFLRSSVLDPLGLSSTFLEGSPASGMIGPVADLVGLAGELQRPTLLPVELAALMTTVAYPGTPGLLPGVGWQATNDWGLGPEIRDHKEPHWTGSLNSPETFGHFGASGGFLWVDPVGGVGLVALSSVDFGPWALAAWPALSDRVLLTVRGGS